MQFCGNAYCSSAFISAIKEDHDEMANSEATQLRRDFLSRRILNFCLSESMVV